MKTHIIIFDDFVTGWRWVKGPWTAHECREYVADSRTCYPDRYRVVPMIGRVG